LGQGIEMGTEYGLWNHESILDPAAEYLFRVAEFEQPGNEAAFGNALTL
jgi:hypothetical protein